MNTRAKVVGKSSRFIFPWKSLTLIRRSNVRNVKVAVSKENLPSFLPKQAKSRNCRDTFHRRWCRDEQWKYLLTHPFWSQLQFQFPVTVALYSNSSLRCSADCFLLLQSAQKSRTFLSCLRIVLFNPASLLFPGLDCLFFPQERGITAPFWAERTSGKYLILHGSLFRQSLKRHSMRLCIWQQLCRCLEICREK